MSRPAVFLDRDGTLNVPPEPGGFVTDPRRLRLLPGVGPALARLREAGLALVVVTNQSCVARGLATLGDVAAVNRALEAALEPYGVVLDRIEVCPSLDPDDPDRKPNPGMLLRAAAVLGLDLGRSVTVGDSPRDVEAGRAAGTAAVLLADPAPARTAADAVFPSLAAAVDWILERTGRPDGEE